MLDLSSRWKGVSLWYSILMRKYFSSWKHKKSRISVGPFLCLQFLVLVQMVEELGGFILRICFCSLWVRHIDFLMILTTVSYLCWWTYDFCKLLLWNRNISEITRNTMFKDGWIQGSYNWISTCVKLYICTPTWL